MGAYEEVRKYLEENGIKIHSTSMSIEKGTILHTIADGDLFGDVYNEITGKEIQSLLCDFAPRVDENKKKVIKRALEAKEQFSDAMNRFISEVALSRMEMRDGEMDFRGDPLMAIQDSKLRELLFSQFENLLKNSFLDPLTGCFNSTYYQHYFGENSQMWGRDEDKKEFNLMLSSLKEINTDSVMFIDMDNFKAVNDLVSHDAGDKVLECVGQTLRNTPGVLPVRRGGDEFVVFGNKASLEALGNTLKSSAFSEKINGHLPKNISLHGAHVMTGASVGITAFTTKPHVDDIVEILNFQTLARTAFADAETEMMKDKALSREKAPAYRTPAESLAGALSSTNPVKDYNA